MLILWAIIILCLAAAAIIPRWVRSRIKKALKRHESYKARAPLTASEIRDIEEMNKRAKAFQTTL